MTTRILAIASLAVVALFGASCERHSWEDSKVLHHHGDHGAHGDDHADGHSEENAGDHKADDKDHGHAH